MQGLPSQALWAATLPGAVGTGIYVTHRQTSKQKEQNSKVAARLKFEQALLEQLHSLKERINHLHQDSSEQQRLVNRLQALYRKMSRTDAKLYDHRLETVNRGISALENQSKLSQKLIIGYSQVISILEIELLTSRLAEQLPEPEDVGAKIFDRIEESLIFWLLTGNKPYRFLEKFYRPRQWLRGKPRCQWSERHPLPLKPHLGKRRVVYRGSNTMKIQVFHALEDAFSLVCYGQLRRHNQDCGFYLLTDKQQRQFRVVWAWDTKGIDPNLSEEAASELRKLENTAMKELPPQVTVRVENSSFATDEDYQPLLDRQLQQSPNRLCDLILYSQKKRIRTLKKAGIRQIKEIRLFAVYEVDLNQNPQSGRDWLTKLMESGSLFLETFRGDKEQADTVRLGLMLSKAYNEGFRRVDSLLNTIMKLEAVPLKAQSLFEADYGKLHDGTPPPLPQILILDTQGLRCEVRDRFTHVTAYLTRPERGRSAVPQSDRAWMYYPLKRKYAGFMEIGKPKSFPPAEGKYKYRGQLRYFFEPSARNRLYDFKIVTEFTKANQGLQKWDLERHTRNANDLSERALTDKTVDVASQRRSLESIEAREALERGEAIMTFATGVWLYRNNPAALEQDFDYLADCLPTAEAERAEEVSEYFWLQLFPFSWERLLARPYDRRDQMFSYELPGMLPLVSPPRLDRSGLEFLSREGGTPVWLDLFSQLMHLLVIATTRAGKSVLLAALIFEFFLQRIPVVVFDYPRPTDGTSTFSDLTNSIRKLGGSAFYFDMGKESNNLIHLPSLRGLSEAQQRRDFFIDFHIGAICVLVMGDVQDDLLEGEVRSLVEQSYRDFQSRPDIEQRYLAANAAKLGTPEYENVPTLWAYLDHVKPWLEKYLAENALLISEKVREAAALILSQLRSCLHGKLGRAIARPSSFPEDADLFVLALRDINTNREAAVAAMTGYSALLRKALSRPNCAFILDEAPILFDFPPIAKRVGQLCANGLKWGCRVVISAQTAEKIQNSVVGDQIFQTVETKIAGYIASEAVGSLGI